MFELAHVVATDETTRHGCETGGQEQRQTETGAEMKEERQRLRVHHGAEKRAPPEGGARRAILALPLGLGGGREGTETEYGEDSWGDACRAPPERTLAMATYKATKHGHETCEQGQRRAKTETEMTGKYLGLRVQLGAGRRAPPEGEARRAALVLLLRQEGRGEGTKTEYGEDDIGDTKECHR